MDAFFSSFIWMKNEKWKIKMKMKNARRFGLVSNVCPRFFLKKNIKKKKGNLIESPYALYFKLISSFINLYSCLNLEGLEESLSSQWWQLELGSSHCLPFHFPLFFLSFSFSSSPCFFFFVLGLYLHVATLLPFLLLFIASSCNFNKQDKHGQNLLSPPSLASTLQPPTTMPFLLLLGELMLTTR